MRYALALIMASLPLAACAEEPPPPKQPESALQLLGEAGSKFFQAIEKMAEDMPQYEMPEVNDRGDIVIRRKNPKAEEPERTRGQLGERT